MRPLAEVIFRCLKEENYLKNLDPDNFSKKTDLASAQSTNFTRSGEGNGKSAEEAIRQPALNAGYILIFQK